MDGDDILTYFKDKSLKKDKKFCFKKVINGAKVENGTSPVTSPFFNKNKPSPVTSLSPDLNYYKEQEKLCNDILKNVEVSNNIPKLNFKKLHDTQQEKKPESSSKSTKAINGFVFKKSTTLKKTNDTPKVASSSPVSKFKMKSNNMSDDEFEDRQVLNGSQSATVKSVPKSQMSKFVFKKKPSEGSPSLLSLRTLKKDTFSDEDNRKVINKNTSKINGISKINLSCKPVEKGVSASDKVKPKIKTIESVSSGSDFDSSPVIKPKKFVFKKTMPTACLDALDRVPVPEKKCASDVKVSLHSKKDSTIKNVPKLEVPQLSTSSKSNSPVIKFSENSITNENKTEIQNNVFNDEVTVISQSLQTTDADFMDDDEFEKLLGNLPNFEDKIKDDLNSSKSTNYSENICNDHDLINDISNINWNEDIFGEQQKDGFTNRSDDSAEFRKFFPHSEIMVDVLHQKFGLREFRPLQREIINASLTQHDCFVLMPTGGGKSLCYQLPAILTPGITVVISPLRALISDQVDKMNGLDIPSGHLCSDVSKAEQDVILSKSHTREPILKLLYVTPEKIKASRVIIDLLNSLYQRGKLARFVIDEAHCLSHWGHDFRPDYKQLSLLRRDYKDVPIMCLTATATKEVENDVINILKLTNVKRFITSFNRPNIKYQVIQKTGKNTVTDISNLIRQKFPKKSGIIYCLCRKDCDYLADELNKLGIRAKPYHAGMNDKVREAIQREWMQDRFHVIVATIAFGMGIDKPDVRFVIHNSIPKSVESFYQESGRAGRDGEVSYSYLFYSFADVGRLQRLMAMDKSVARNLDGHFENLNQMVAFAENVIDCRRYLQLLHLGEKFDRNICIRNKETTCDNCENIDKYKTIDVTDHAKDLCVLVREITQKENVTLLHIVDIYKGSNNKKIHQKGHNRHRLFGNGKNMDRIDIQRILKNLVFDHVLADYSVHTGEFPVVYIKPGRRYSSINDPNLKVNISVSTSRPVKIPKVDKVETDYPELDVQEKPSTSAVSPKKAPATKQQIAKLKVTCHEELLEECRRLALEKNVTLSSIMNLSAIKSMSELLPNTKELMLKVQHVTVANFNKYGEFFMNITKKFREKIDELKAASSNDSFDDDWATEYKKRTSGVKRKPAEGASSGGGAKRFKKYYRKKGGAKKGGAAKTGGGGKKGWYGKKGGSGGGGKLGLMPMVHFK